MGTSVQPTGLEDLLQPTGGGLDDLLTPVDTSNDTAIGRVQAQNQNIDQNIKALAALRMKATDPGDQARIDRVLKSLQDQKAKVGKADDTGSTIENVAKGVGAGIAKAPLEVGQLAAAIPAIAGSQTAKDLRASLAERAQQITEEVQPAGLAGAVGEFAGELPAQALAFGPVGKVVGKVASKVVPALAPIFAEKLTGNLASRVAQGGARAAIEVAPITGIAAIANRQEGLEWGKQALTSGKITQEQYDNMSKLATVDAIKEFAVSTLGGAGFGAAGEIGGTAFRAAKEKLGGVGKESVGGEGAAPVGLSQAEVIKREAELQALNAKAAADAARKAEAAQDLKLAKAQWTLDNPTGSWKSDLDTGEKASYISDFKTKRAAAQQAQPGAPSVAAPTIAIDQANKELAIAQAGGSSEAVQAAEAKVAEVQAAPVIPPAPVVDASSPTLDKGSGGLSPTVKNYMQRQGLKNAFKEAGLPFDEGLTNAELQAKLAEGIKAKQVDTAQVVDQVQQEAVTKKNYSELIASGDIGKKLGIEDEVLSGFGMGQQPEEIVANLADKLPSFLTPAEKLDLVNTVHEDWTPAKIGPETVDTSYEALTGRKMSDDFAPEELAKLAPTAASEGAKPTLGTETLPPASPAVAVAVPTRTFLEGVPSKIPLEEMSAGQIDKMKDLVADGIAQAHDEGDPLHAKQLMSDLGLLSKETQKREAANPTTTLRPFKDLSPGDLQVHREALESKIEGLKNVDSPTKKTDLADARARLSDVQAEISTRKIEARQSQGASRAKVPVEPLEETKPIPPTEFKKAPSKLSNDALDRQIEDINDRLSVLDPRDSEPWQERLSKLFEEKAGREAKNEGPDGMPPIKSGDGVKLQSHPAVGAFLAGSTYGYLTAPKEDTDEEKLSRAFMWGLGSAGLVMGAKYLAARTKAWDTAKPSSWFESLGIKPITHSLDDLKGPKPSTLAKLREFYRGTIRGTEAIEQMTKSTGGLNLPTQKNPGKLAAYWGRYSAQTESWITSGPSLVQDDGSVLKLTGKSFQDILATAKGDKEGLDELMVALSSAELAGKLGENRVPRNQIDRELIIRNAPAELMEAARDMRQYHANLLQTQLDAGLISKEGLATMVAENWYTPMQRVVEQLDAIKQSKPDFKGAPSAIEARGMGGKLEIQSPSDVTVNMTGRMLRAAEYGKFLNAFVDHVNSLPSFVKQEILVPTNRAMNPKGGQLEGIAAELRKAAGISEADARSMVAYLDSDMINSNPGVITHYENGVLQSYKVRPDIFQAIKSMNAPEIDGFWRMIGMPTRWATQGTTLNPMFTFRRGIIETFLGSLGSEYGFRPVLDQIPAWYEAFTRSPRFREMQAAGGTGTVQSMQFQQLAKFGGNNALVDSWKLMKEGSPIQAYRTLMEPFTMTARVAEYLAALRHGASTLEAAYAANNLLGNVRMQGYSNGMRVFNHLSMFARPTIAHVDRLLEKSGLHPYRVPEYNKTDFGAWAKDAGIGPRTASGLTFMTKAFAGITLPSIALWYMNRNDDEINDVRRTDAGSHYWFFRNAMIKEGDPGAIMRIPKPQVVGQIFGSSVEATLDRMDKDDHDGLMRTLSGLYDEAALNVVPQIGVVPLGLWANRDFRFGSPIVKGADAGADPNAQGFTDASLPSRIISDKLSSVTKDLNNDAIRRAASPAGIDYLINNFAGMMGQDALRAVNDAMLYRRDGFLPAKEELPLISRVLARYPSMNTYQIQKFYARDQKVQAAATTVEKLVSERPDLLSDYYAQNSERLQLVNLHREIRQKIADFRRAIEDVKNAPSGTYDQKTKDDMIKQFTSLIIQHAKTANEIAANMGMP